MFGGADESINRVYDRTEVMLFGSPSGGLHAVGDLAYGVTLRSLSVILIQLSM